MTGNIHRQAHPGEYIKIIYLYTRFSLDKDVFSNAWIQQRHRRLDEFGAVGDNYVAGIEMLLASKCYWHFQHVDNISANYRYNAHKCHVSA